MQNLSEYESLHDMNKRGEEVPFSLEKWNGFTKTLLSVMKENGFVHGDLRLPNIMYHKRGGEPLFMVVDFDWAGRNNEAIYPRNISWKIKWPEGVKAGAKILHEHDKAAITILDSTLFGLH